MKTPKKPLSKRQARKKSGDFHPIIGKVHKNGTRKERRRAASHKDLAKDGYKRNARKRGEAHGRALERAIRERRMLPFGPKLRKAL